jgi:hypothetical protein
MAIKVREQAPTEPRFDVQVPAAVVKTTEMATEDAKDFLAVVEAMPIENEEQYEAAMAERKTAKAEWDKLEARRVAITGPLNAALKSTNDLFRPPQTLWKSVWEKIDAAAKPFLRRKDEEREAAERARQAELARLNARGEKAAEKGQETKAAVLQTQAAVLASAPLPVEAPKAAGTSAIDKWAYQVTDVRAAVLAALDGQVTYEVTKPATTNPWTGDIVITIKMGKFISGVGDRVKVPGIVAVKDYTITSRR